MIFFYTHFEHATSILVQALLNLSLKLFPQNSVFDKESFTKSSTHKHQQ